MKEYKFNLTEEEVELLRFIINSRLDSNDQIEKDGDEDLNDFINLNKETALLERLLIEIGDQES